MTGSKLNPVILSFAEIIYITVDSGGNYLYGSGSVADFIYSGFLVFEILVNRKEMAHLLENVAGELIDVRVVIVGRIREGDRNDLFIASAVVDHGYNTDRVCADERHGLDRLGTEDEHVQRVKVIAVGARNKAVICGIVCGSIKNSVKHDVTGFLIKLVLFLASLGNFHNAYKILGRDALG